MRKIFKSFRPLRLIIAVGGVLALGSIAAAAALSYNQAITFDFAGEFFGIFAPSTGITNTNPPAESVSHSEDMAVLPLVTIPANGSVSGISRQPLGTAFGFQRSASIYTAAELGMSPGSTITNMCWYVNTSSSPGNAPTKIYMKTIAAASFVTGTTVAAEESGATLTYSATPTLTYTPNNSYQCLSLSTPFFYDGNNLEIIVETNQGSLGNESPGSKQFWYSSASNAHQVWEQSTTAPTGISTGGAGNSGIKSSRPAIRFNFVPPLGPGDLQMSAASYSGFEGGIVGATVNRVLGGTGTVGVTYTLTNGTATGAAACDPGVDYINPGPQFLTFNDLVLSQPISVQTCTDAVLEGTQTFTITLSAPTGGAGLGTPVSSTGSITDITPPFSGTVNVGSGQIFTSLTNPGGLFEAINTYGAISNFTINVTSDLSGETGSVSLSEIAGGYTVMIQPSGGPWTVSGAAASGLIRLEGTDGVTFACGNSLTFRNTSAAPVLTFFEDATGNVVNSCIFEGVSTGLASGTILFSTSSGSLGNSNNTISNSTLRNATAVLPTHAVYSSGSVDAPNTANNISNNSIYNFFNGGINVSGTGVGDGWTISSNSLYQIGTRTITTTAIGVFGGSGHTISSNFIGGTAPNAGGANWATTQSLRGIDVTVGTTSPTSIYSNTIKNIRSSLVGSFVDNYGIFVEAGMVNIGHPTDSSNGNTIGSSSVSERFEVGGSSYGIRVSSTSTCRVRNNAVNNMNTAAGVASGLDYRGISVEGIGGSHSVENNTVANISNGSQPNASFVTTTFGLYVIATGVQTVRGNTIANIGNTSSAAVTVNNNLVFGVLIRDTALGSVVEGNSISNIYGSSPTAGPQADIVYCLFADAGNTNVKITNNFISTDGGGASDRVIYGIFERSVARVEYRFNSVNIFGTQTAANNTAAFNRADISIATLRNNIFSNKRTGGTGAHIALANTFASAAGWDAAASNNNLLFNNNPATLTSWFNIPQSLAAFKAITGGDAATTSGDPQFVGNTDLHIPVTSPAVGSGVPSGSVMADYDNDPRPSMAPDIGADEIVQAEFGLVNAGTYYNAALAYANMLTGNVTVTRALYLTGESRTGANTLTLGCNTLVSGAGGANYVVGNVKKDFCATGLFTFPVGTIDPAAFLGGAPQYTPMSANITAGTFPSSLTVSITDNFLPGIVQSSAVSRYWTVTETGDLTADMTFTYLDPTDVNGNEANYKVFRREFGVTAQATPNSNDPGANTATVLGVTDFSDWGIGAFVPTAANVSVAGRVTTQNGLGIRNAVIVVTGNNLPHPIIARTGSFGYYMIENLPAGETYIVTVNSKRFTFQTPSRVISVTDSITSADFVANPQ